MDKRKINWLILLFTIVYTIGAGIYFLSIGNYEFLLYVGILALLILFMSLLHKKFKFSSWVLFASSLWGLLHMLGGGLYIKGTRLYNYILFDIYSGEIPGMQILKYDQFMHFYTYIVITFILFYIIKNYLKKDVNWLVIFSILILASVGVGAINEIIEFIPVVFFDNTGVGGYHNTLLDIIFNTLGAIVGVIWLNWKRKLV